MIRPVYETNENREDEERVATYLSEKFRVSIIKQPKFSRIDRMIYEGDRLVAGIEIKSRNWHRDYKTYMLADQKFSAMIGWGQVNQLPVWLGVHRKDDGLVMRCKLFTPPDRIISHGTARAGRTDRNDEADIEKCVFFDMKLFEKIGTLEDPRGTVTPSHERRTDRGLPPKPEDIENEERVYFCELCGDEMGDIWCSEPDFQMVCDRCDLERQKGGR